MSRLAETTLDWADGTYKFALKIDQMAELQEKCDAGPWYIQWALGAALLARESGFPPPREMRVEYVSEVIRLSLIGGGMDALQALKKVRSYAGAGQINENIAHAYAVIGVLLMGAPDEDGGKPVAGGKKTTANRSRAAKSGSQTSTDGEASSA